MLRASFDQIWNMIIVSQKIAKKKYLKNCAYCDDFLLPIINNFVFFLPKNSNHSNGPNPQYFVHISVIAAKCSVFGFDIHSLFLGLNS